MVVIGIWLALSAQRRSCRAPYRLLVARARLLWRDNAHKFLSCAGCAIVLAGIITALA
jgi:hypothetical protein